MLKRQGLKKVGLHDEGLPTSFWPVQSATFFLLTRGFPLVITDAAESPLGPWVPLRSSGDGSDSSLLLTSGPASAVTCTFRVAMVAVGNDSKDVEEVSVWIKG